MQPIQQIFSLLTVPKKIVITCHHKPDGDAMGSMLGLYHYLIKLGHDVAPISPNEVPDFLQWLPGMEHVYNFEAEPKICNDLIHQAEIVFCLDFNQLSRVKELEPALSATSALLVLIDHHLYPADVFQYGISIPEKSSTCEMVFDFIKEHTGLKLLDKTIATCLYTGVLTDTGSFRFPIVTAEVHQMISDLKQTGLEHHLIHEKIYDSWSFNRLKFVGKMLSERMEVLPQYKTAFISVSLKDLANYSCKSSDTEGLVNYPLSIEGIKFAVLITEKPEEVRLSFRSKGDFDANLFARTYFEGGGHFHASGGKSTLNLTETVEKFKQSLTQYHPN